MRREHRPIYLKRAKQAFDRAFASRFVFPHFDAVGQDCSIENPYHVYVMGSGIELGRAVAMVASREAPRIRLVANGSAPGLGRIRIGDYAVINPGARISSGCSIEIGKNALFASNVVLMDTDWHGRYDRVYDHGGSAPIVLEDNVWLGEGVLVCKGVTIGKNSIVGARSVVVHDVPAHSIAAGNPARVVGELDPAQRYVSRSDVYDDLAAYVKQLGELEQTLLGPNTLRHYLRYLLSPKRTD